MDLPEHVDEALSDLDRAFASLSVVELDPRLARFAGEVAERFGLRAYDAVHLASVLIADEDETVVLTWDRALAAAATDVGLGLAPSESTVERTDEAVPITDRASGEHGAAVGADELAHEEVPLVRSQHHERLGDLLHGPEPLGEDLRLLGDPLG